MQAGIQLTTVRSKPRPIITNFHKFNNLKPYQMGQEILLNCQKLAFINYQVANSLLQMHEKCKNQQGRLILINISDQQREQLKQTGVISKLILATPEETEQLV